MDEDKLAKRLSEICAELKRTKDAMQQIRLLHEVNMLLHEVNMLDIEDKIFIDTKLVREILEESKKHDKKED